MFTTDTSKQAAKDKHQEELAIKASLDAPLFSNVRESLKNFTDSIQN